MRDQRLSHSVWMAMALLSVFGIGVVVGESHLGALSLRSLQESFEGGPDIAGLARDQSKQIPKTAVVSTVIDGDTVHLQANSGEYILVRLADIDAPEFKQPYWWQSTAELGAMVEGKTVRVDPQEFDRYKRLVARLYVDDLDVSEQMFDRGAAWFYHEYAKDNSLFHAENEARDRKAGL